MYDNQEKPEYQELLRISNPDASHCAFLRDSPKACDFLPYELGESCKGDICPNNPFESYAKIFAAIANQGDLVTDADYLLKIWKLGRLPEFDELTEEEFVLFTAAQSHHEAEKAGAPSMFGSTPANEE